MSEHPPQPPRNPYEPNHDPNQPQYGQGYQGEYHQGQQQYRSANSIEARSFFAGLFDLSFQSFVTLKFARIIYIIVLIAIALAAVFGWLIGSFGLMSQEPIAGVIMLILGWIPLALQLIFARLVLEFFVATARTAQSTAATREELERIRSFGGGR